MKPKEFLNAVDLVVKEKGIDKEVIFDAMELALTSAYKKNYNAPNVRVSINKDTGDIRVCSFLNVVEEIDEGYNISIPDGQELIKVGKNTVTITYSGKTTTFNIDVCKVKDKSLILASRPNKINYLIGDKFDSTGLILELIDDTGKREEIKDGYVLSVTDGTVLNEAGVKEIIVTYNEKEVKFKIEVLEVTKITIQEENVKKDYTVGDKFDDTGMTLVAEYSNGTKEVITTNYKINNNEEFTTTGNKVITVSYGNAEAKIDVTVENNENSTNIKNNSSRKGITWVHIAIVIVISLAITIFFEYKRNN